MKRLVLTVGLWALAAVAVGAEVRLSGAEGEVRPAWVAGCVREGEALWIGVGRALAPERFALRVEGTSALPWIMNGYAVVGDGLALRATVTVEAGAWLMVDLAAADWAEVAWLEIVAQDGGTPEAVSLDFEEVSEEADTTSGAVGSEVADEASASGKAEIVWVEATSPSRACPVAGAAEALLPAGHTTLCAAAYRPFSSQTFDVGAEVSAATRTEEGALRFRGGQAVVNLGQPATLELGDEAPCAISAWIRPEKVDGLRNIVARGFLASPKRELYLRFSAGKVQFGWWCDWGEACASAAYSPAVGTWAHVMGVFDGAAYVLYVNGVEVARKASTLRPVSFNADWAIGRHATQAARYFQGDIGEVSFYRGVVSPEGVAVLAAAKARGLSEASVLGAWRVGGQLVALTDTAAPTLTVPPGATLPAPGGDCSVAARGVATAADVASEDVAVTHVDVGPDFVETAEGFVRERLTRVWLAEDAAGLETAEAQVFDLSDATPPTLTVPPDATVSQTQGIDPAATGVATATDNSGHPPEVTWRDVADDAAPLRLLPGLVACEAGTFAPLVDGGKALGGADLLDVRRGYTLSAAVKPDADLRTRRGQATILSKGFVGGNELIFRVENGCYQFGFARNGNKLISYTIPEEDVGRWVTLTGTLEGRQLRLYRDGVEIRQGVTAIEAPTYAADWALGFSPTHAGREWHGELRDVAIWNRPLAPEECADVAALPHAAFAAFLAARPDPARVRTVVREWTATDPFGNVATGTQTITVTGAYADGDGDGLCDCLEREVYGSDPAAADTDGDGLADGMEALTLGTDPTNADSDGDRLPDGWEVAHGFDPRVAGETYLDPDGDGLVNVSEYAAGTDPHAADTDGDGLDDATETLSAHSDPRVADIGEATPLGDAVAGETFVGATGNWERAGGAAVAVERAGSLTYRLEAPAGADALAVRVAQDNVFAEADDFDLSLAVDGVFVARLVVAAPHGSPAEALFFLPEIEPGAHDFTLTWRNWRTNTFLAVHDLRFLAFGGPDADGDGVPDWRDHRAADTTTVTPLPEISLVSPVCLEGTDLWRDVLEVVADYADGTATTNAVIPTIGEGFYANVPLDPSGAPITLTLDDRAKRHAFPVAWAAFDLTDETRGDAPLVIRAGDALRLFGGAGGPSVLTVLQAQPDDTWAPVTNLVSEVAVPYAFAEPGLYRVVAEAPDGSGIRGEAFVEAVSSRFPLGVIGQWMGKPRTVDCPGLDPAALLEYDGALNVSAAPKGTGLSLTVDARLDRDHGLVSRLTEAGSILDAAQVRPIWGDNGSYYRVVERYSDGSWLTEVVLQLGAVPSGLTVKLEIFVAGVTFDDGTRVKTLTAADFDANGRCRLLFIRGANVSTSVCHRTYLYQNGVELGNNRND